MKITRRQLSYLIKECMTQSYLLTESINADESVNIKSDRSIEGMTRAKRGQYYLVHWGDKNHFPPSRNHIKDPKDVKWIMAGDAGKWNINMVNNIIKQYPAKGVFTQETVNSIESQKITGKTATGSRGSSLSDELDSFYTMSSDIAATILDAIPSGITQGAAVAITANTLRRAISSKDYLAIGLNVIALLPFAIGDTFKAAYPWVKKIAKMASSDAHNVGDAAVQAIAAMINEWDKYKNRYIKLATDIIREKDIQVSPDFIKKSFDAIDNAMSELKKPLPKSLRESYLIKDDTMKITRRQLRRIILEAINIHNKQIEVNNGNIIVDGELFSIEANAGWKTAGQFVEVTLTDIQQVSGGLQVTGTALGTNVDDLVPDKKVAEITQGVNSGEPRFEVQGKKAVFRFNKI